ncbi:MAG: hypothetical protein EOM19_01160 [Candidatus Moranbacteria bacterium]|nr:hypothetical protein [Candidatus Moranbacteria bacterium]
MKRTEKRSPLKQAEVRVMSQQVRKMFSLCACTTPEIHGYFLDENGFRIIPFAINSLRDGKVWINVLKKNGNINDEETRLFEEDLLLSGIPDESSDDFMSSFIKNDIARLPYFILFGLSLLSEDMPEVDDETINESGINPDQDPWM